MPRPHDSLQLCPCLLMLGLFVVAPAHSRAQAQRPVFPGQRAAGAQGDRPAPVWTQRQGTVTGGRGVTGWIQTESKNIDNDPRRAYVLLSPGGRSYYGRRRIRNADGTYQYMPLDKAAVPTTSSAGLLVVLPAGDADPEKTTQFWTEAMRNVLKGRYYVAIAVPPRHEGAKTVVWLTETTVKETNKNAAKDTNKDTKEVKEAKDVKDVKDVKEAAPFSTESFAADIARDASANYNIDPNRIFLHGAAESGLAVYACSLSDASPFKGFYIHDAPFRSAQLPPLTHAKGRRYFLQQSLDDKADPYWMAEAARKLLSDKGASVKLTSYQGSGAYNFPGDTRWDKMTEALTWLETPPKTK